MDRPILFSAPMVCAILDGKKTQTRRAIKNVGGAFIGIVDRGGPRYWFGDDARITDGPRTSIEVRCPYGQPGDRLWVREAFSGPHCMERTEDLPAMPPSQWPVESDIWYWADGDPTHGDWTRPRPSIHMPRFASRITLEITGVRVERLRDISERDAIAEGAPGYEEGIDAPPPDEECEWSCYASFSRLWKSINGPGSWDANPWVFVVEFKRVTP